MEYLDALLTFNAPEGDIYKLNENAAVKNVELNPETVKIIKKALQVSELSNGAFDITIGPVVKSWGIGTKQEYIPTKEELQNLLPLVNYKDISIDGYSVGLKKAGQMIDLGGIAKGYAGDVALEIYKKHGIKAAFINIGGNVVTLGTKPDGSPWSTSVLRAKVDKATQKESYSTNYVTASAIFDKSDKIVSVQFDILEIAASSTKEGATIFPRWPTVETKDAVMKNVSDWKTKRERGDVAYGMNWSEQVDSYQELFKGKTVAEVEQWYAKNTSDVNGTPLVADSEAAEDKAKFAKLTDAEKTALADVTSGASISLNDSHGDFMGALKEAFANKFEVTPAK